MGVPSFYRWLANKYPKIVINADEKTTEEENVDGNTNGIEFDNLYLDMNGIIHPCFYPENDDVIITYEQVFNNIFDYIDRIMNIVRPRKLLYMAIDGVAPRAKMNQQRTRRFKNAKDSEILKKEEDRIRKQYEIDGRDVLEEQESEVSDSNVITPGTEFMYELSRKLQTYINLRIANHHSWKRLRVILSDANCPGEGEHKIMSFVRNQRTCKGYDPNTSHVLYGLDADLIMLALSTHEIHFSILRENVFVDDITQTNSSSVAEINPEAKFDLDGGLKDTVQRISSLEISNVSKPKFVVKKPYQFLHVWILREYLNFDLKMTNLPEKFECDIERLIDDFIFICFFAGNDFLPHMPTLEIHEGAMDLLIHVYKEEFTNLGGYLVDAQRINDKKGGYIKLKRVEKFILAVGAYEDKIFKKRFAFRERHFRRINLDFEDARENGEDESSTEIRSTYIREGSNDQEILDNTKLLKEQLKSYTRESSDLFKNGRATDAVKFGSPGWRKRYYKYKFSAETEEDVEKTRKKLVEKYTEGLCWVLLYYFSGVPSWNWFYPYHYGPFASDLKGLSSTKIEFQKGLPFKPFDQLMAVLPPMSSRAIPLSYRSLMTDEESSILDFYPSDFEVDTDGKRFISQGICKVPFIDEDRLLAATKKIEKELGEEEAKRNVEDVDQLFVHSSEKLAINVGAINQSSSIKIDTGLSGDINGSVRLKRETVKDSDVLCLYYDPPCFTVHNPCVLEGATIPETIVSESDIEERQLWHDIHGYQGRNYRPSYNQTDGDRSRPGVSCRNWYPDVITKGGGSGWSPRGRGYNSGSYHNHDAYTRTSNEQTRGQSWWDTHGRGACGNRNDGTNGQFWSVRTGSGSSSNQAFRRWGDAQSRNAPGDVNNGRWRRSN